MKSKPPIDRMTLSRQAYQALRSMVLRGQVAPGTSLIVRELAEGLMLSATPVKEALAALEREGLVELVPHRGYFVPHLGRKDISEIYALRVMLEGLAARLAAEEPERQRSVKKLRQLLGEQEKRSREKDLERYGDLDMQFHRTIWEASGNKRLVQAAETLAGQARLLISTSAAIHGRLSLSIEEQTRIVEAIHAGLPDQAEQAMGDHVRRAGEALMQRLEDAPAGSV